jgi:hypothetical protein
VNEPIFSERWIEEKVSRAIIVNPEDKESEAFAHSLKMCLSYLAGIWREAQGIRNWQTNALLPFLITSSPAVRSHPYLFERLYHCCRFMMYAIQTENKLEVDKSLGLVDDLCIEFAYRLGGMPEADAADRRIKGIK